MTVSAPVQDRSKKTLKAIISATESLLETQQFEKITIAEIVAKARCTTGSFYARFESKEALLPALYANYDNALPMLFASIMDRHSDNPPPLADLLAEIATAVAGSYAGRPNLMRAMMAHARSQSDAINAETIDQRRALVARIIALFAPHFDWISHDDPARAIETTLFVMIAALRDRILFPNAPNAAVLDANPTDFTNDMAAMALAYLTCPQGK